MTRRKILNLCYVPHQWHHELGLLRSYYARVEHKVVVGVDIVNYLAVTSLILIWRHCGMKRPGPTLHVRLRETGSTDRLTYSSCIGWMAGVCPSHFSRIGFDEQGLYEG